MIEETDFSLSILKSKLENSLNFQDYEEKEQNITTEEILSNSQPNQINNDPNNFHQFGGNKKENKDNLELGSPNKSNHKFYLNQNLVIGNESTHTLKNSLKFFQKFLLQDQPQLSNKLLQLLLHKKPFLIFMNFLGQLPIDMLKKKIDGSLLINDVQGESDEEDEDEEGDEDEDYSNEKETIKKFKEYLPLNTKNKIKNDNLSIKTISKFNNLTKLSFNVLTILIGSEDNLKPFLKKYFNQITETIIRITDFFLELLNNVCTQKSGEILFQRIFLDKKFIKNIMNIICENENKYPILIKKEYIRAILSLIKKSVETIYDVSDVSDLGKIVPNRIMYVTGNICHGFSYYIPDICQAISTTYSKGTEKKFGLDRIYLLEFLTEMFEYYFDPISIERQDPAEYLNKIPTYFWNNLTKWFFQYPENSFYQELFFRLFYFSTTIQHESFFPSLLKNFNFLNRMIKQYNPKKKIGLSSFIILFCNLIRLTALQPKQKNSKFLKYLSNHRNWKKFNPILKKETEKMIPSDPITQPFYSSRKIVNKFDYRIEGIDLQSGYAQSLGFVEKKSAKYSKIISKLNEIEKKLQIEIGSVYFQKQQEKISVNIDNIEMQLLQIEKKLK
ncbi:hypothetical protein M0813_11563 [Anaeramoeba flamelloides]|uniref:Uncharacterized protein n=1 Tax=Anaeramoeba flamelloides TaxID=1746091 RepID=A0ABQ8ZEN4_9EUKA|nr:hypothetical protein M0813_11563 [Anaeramoeba flamelloides]